MADGNGSASVAANADAAAGISSISGGSNGNGKPAVLPVIVTGDFNATPESVPCKV